MKKSAKLLVQILTSLICMFTGMAAYPQTSAAGSRGTTGSASTVDQAINRVIEREHEEMDILDRYHPIIETYVQDSRNARGEAKIWRDWYFLGIANMAGAADVHALIS